jgi:hypothetical protein
MGKLRLRGDRLIDFRMGEVFVFIKNLSVPRTGYSATTGLKEGKSRWEKRPLPDSDLGFGPFCQKSLQLGKLKLWYGQLNQTTLGYSFRSASLNGMMRSILASESRTRISPERKHARFFA